MTILITDVYRPENVSITIRFPERAKHISRFRLATPGEILELSTDPEHGHTNYRVVHADLDHIVIEMVKESDDQPQGDSA